MLKLHLKLFINYSNNKFIKKKIFTILCKYYYLLKGNLNIK